MTSRENIQSGQISYLYSEIASIISGGGGGVPTSSNLADVLTNGNSAGSNGIDMNQQDITNGNVINIGSNGNIIDLDGASSTLTLTDNLGNINVITALGSSIPSANADSVLTTATTTNATFYPTFLGATTGYNSCGVDTGLTYNPSTHTETFTDGSGNSTIINPTSITTGTLNYTTLNPPITIPTDTLSAVLTAGNTATNSIILNNGATNVITTDPSLNTIVITDGTTTNTINKSGYTTRNSVQNISHYLNFSDSSSTGVGAIQKTAGLSCNPSTNTITATTFVGDLSGNATSATTSTNTTNVNITDDNTSSTFYPVFVSNNTGNLPLKVDKTTSPLSYVPSTGTLTTQVFSGSLNGAITATSVNPAINTPIFPILTSSFQGGQPLTGNGLTYIPSTNALTATTFVGDLSGNATSATNTSTTLTTTAGTYYPVFVSNNVSGNYPNLVGVMTYNPSSNTITANTFNGGLSGTATNATNVGITSDNTNGTYYIPFTKTSGSGNKPLFQDDTTTPLTYNPSTSTLTATTFSGSLSGNATTATTATNIAGGLGGSIPYQTAVNATSLLANGTAGQVLTSQGTTLAPIWTTPSSSSNASTINITDTPTTAGTYYPTFVSASGSTQTLRVDSQYLQYNPSTNVLQNPSFLISDGTETATNGGLVIAGAGSSTKTFTTTKSSLGATRVGMNFTSSMSGTSSSSMELTSASSTLNGKFLVLTYNNPSNYMSNYISLDPDYTNFASKGIAIEQNYVDAGANSIITGFTTNNNLSSTYSSYEGTTEESRVDVAYANVSIKSGTTGSPTEIVKITTNGLNVKNAVNNYTFVATTLTLNFQSTSFRNFYNATSITTAITQSAVSFSNAVAGGSYMVYITTGVGGSLTFNTGISGVKTTFSSNFTIPASSFAVMSIYYINSVYVVGINILT